MDYSKLTDQEINMLVAKIQHPDKVFIDRKTRPPSVVLLNHINMWIDYCNNPVDAWPIIVEHGITVLNDKNCYPRATNDSFTFIHEQFDDCIHALDKNPLRAAMIVFLTMQEQSHE